jgi:hypothetical protein
MPDPVNNIPSVRPRVYLAIIEDTRQSFAVSFETNLSEAAVHREIHRQLYTSMLVVIVSLYILFIACFSPQ